MEINDIDVLEDAVIRLSKLNQEARRGILKKFDGVIEGVLTELGPAGRKIVKKEITENDFNLQDELDKIEGEENEDELNNTVKNLAIIKRGESDSDSFAGKIFGLLREAKQNPSCLKYDINWVTDNYVHIIEEFIIEKNAVDEEGVSLSKKHKEIVKELKEEDMLYLTGLNQPL